MVMSLLTQGMKDLVIIGRVNEKEKKEIKDNKNELSHKN